MSGLTIHADGIDWPLQTYLDALGFKSIDAFAAPVIDGEVRCDVVTRAGDLRCGCFASDVLWHDAMAWRPLNLGICESCGDPLTQPGTTVCDGCEDNAWWPA